MIRISAQALLAALLALAFANAAAQSDTSSPPPAGEAPEYPPVYRVELVVFNHVDGRSDRLRAESAADFTGLLDPLLVAAANRRADATLARLHEFLPMVPLPGTVDEATPYLETESATMRPIPPVYADLGRLSLQSSLQLSPRMQRALDRLLDSPEFEPLAARSWIQLAEPRQATATLRVHDQAVVDLLPPARTGRLAPFFIDWLGLPAGVVIGDQDRATGRFRPAPPRALYRLDGSARLGRRQFLHLYLDLVWQERARSMPAVPASPGERTGPPAVSPGREPAPDAQPEWQRHRLLQSRVIEPGRMEYFDSSRFGVLALVQRFEQVVPEVESPPERGAGPTGETPPPATQSGR